MSKSFINSFEDGVFLPFRRSSSEQNRQCALQACGLAKGVKVKPFLT
jgi:hypothetical protein